MISHQETPIGTVSLHILLHYLGRGFGDVPVVTAHGNFPTAYELLGNLLHVNSETQEES